MALAAHAQGRGVLDQFIFFDEVQRAGAPFPFVTINTVGPTLLAEGCDGDRLTRQEFFANCALLVGHTTLDAKSIVTESLNIAGDVCIYTNRNITVEEL